MRVHDINALMRALSSGLWWSLSSVCVCVVWQHVFDELHMCVTTEESPNARRRFGQMVPFYIVNLRWTCPVLCRERDSVRDPCHWNAAVQANGIPAVHARNKNDNPSCTMRRRRRRRRQRDEGVLACTRDLHATLLHRGRRQHSTR